MKTIKGTIQNIHQSRMTVDNGNGQQSPLHSITLRGIAGWFRLGTTPCAYPAGTEVAFEATDKNHVRNLRTVTAQTATDTGTVSTKTDAGVARNFDEEAKAAKAGALPGYSEENVLTSVTEEGRRMEAQFKGIPYTPYVGK